MLFGAMHAIFFLPIIFSLIGPTNILKDDIDDHDITKVEENENDQDP